jgi:signal peptidase II
MNQAINKILPKNQKIFLLGLLIILITMGADLYSKKQIFGIIDQIATSHISDKQIKITDFFNLVKVLNPGVSFGMFNQLPQGQYIIAAVNSLIIVILLIWLYRNEKLYLTWALALIIGGALGNLIDRLQNKAVADFLDFHLFSYHWPAFNLADSAVFIGVAMLLTENFFTNEK